jgi:hypothetical protein
MNKFRPSSFSEGYIDNINNNDVNIYKSLAVDITESINVTTITSHNNKKCNYNFNNKYFSYFIKRLLLFLIHLNLIALFEIFFFFYVVANYEDDALYGVIDGYTDNIDTFCINANYTEKIYITNIINKINYTSIYDNYIYAHKHRLKHNHNLFIKAWMFFLAISLFNCVLLLLNKVLKLRINLCKMLIDNVFMIIILGIFEYIFLQSIILRYSNVTTNELTKYIIDNFDDCLITLT